MRLRHIKGAEEEIARSPYVIQEPGEWKGRWNQLFGNSNPVRIEIGMGKGKFLMELAKNNPDINYVGIERDFRNGRSWSCPIFILSAWMHWN